MIVEAKIKYLNKFKKFIIRSNNFEHYLSLYFVYSVYEYHNNEKKKSS